MPQIFSVEQRGVGKPDYSRETSVGRERAGLYLKYNQRLKIFGHGFHVGDADYPLIPESHLTPDFKTHLFDLETYIPTPFTVPAGYTLSLFVASGTVNEDMMLYAYMDSVYFQCLSTPPGGMLSYFDKILGVTTTVIDPNADRAHTIDLVLRNRGGGNLYGGVQLVGIMERIGSSAWPTTKNCKCPYCENIQTVPVDTSTIVCSACDKLYIVYNLVNFKSTV